MASGPVVRLPAGGYRFLVRRMELAVLGADLRETRRGARTRSLALGSVLAAAVVAASALLGPARPRALPDDAPIVMGSESGVLYVRMGDTWHPVLNMASARLIAAGDVPPRRVRDSDINGAKRGPLLGVPGAPQVFGPPVSDRESIWTICDVGSPPATTVIVGELATGSPPARWGPEHTVWVSADSGTVYRLHRGARAVVQRPGPSARVPRPVSTLLLNAIPEVPPIAEAAPAAAIPPAADDAGALCVTWTPHGGTTLATGAGLPLPPGRHPVSLAQADGGGPALDAVYLPPGRSAYVQAAGARYLVTEAGVRFAIADDDTARCLGLPATAGPAPWPVLAGLPQGPELNRQSALTAWDVVGAGHLGPPRPPTPGRQGQH